MPNRQILFVLLALAFHSLSPLSAQPPEAYSVYVPMTQYDNGGDKLQFGVVLAPSGLRMRSKPAFDAPALALMPFGAKVKRFAPRPYLDQWDAEFSNENRVCLPGDSLWGWWEEVEWQGQSGYAFNAYLGQGLLKMTGPWHLLPADGGYCQNETYYDPAYNFYAVTTRRDGSAERLQKVQPTYYASHNGFALAGSSIRVGVNPMPLFILATRESLPERPVRLHNLDRMLFSGNYNEETKQLQPDSLQNLTLPGTSWEITPSAKPLPDGRAWQLGLTLRDKKTGRHQVILKGYPEADTEDSGSFWGQYILLRYSGDLDGDNVDDFLLSVGSLGEEWTHLFLSRAAHSGELVHRVSRYDTGCQEFVSALRSLAMPVSEDALALRAKIEQLGRQPVPADASPAEKMLGGQKSFGSHWLSDQYGACVIAREDGQLMCYGVQHDRDNRSQTLLRGKVRLLDDRNFEVTGELRLEYAAGGEYTVLTEPLLFRRVGERKFWRLKQPEGAPTGLFQERMHYIDIFMEFNKTLSPNYR